MSEYHLSGTFPNLFGIFIKLGKTFKSIKSKILVLRPHFLLKTTGLILLL